MAVGKAKQLQLSGWKCEKKLTPDGYPARFLNQYALLHSLLEANPAFWEGSHLFYLN